MYRFIVIHTLTFSSQELLRILFGFDHMWVSLGNEKADRAAREVSYWNLEVYNIQFYTASKLCEIQPTIDHFVITNMSRKKSIIIL